MTEKLFVQCAPMKHESINFLLCSSLPEQPLNLTAVWRWVKEARGWKLKLAGGGGLSCIIDTTFGYRHTEKQDSLSECLNKAGQMERNDRFSFMQPNTVWIVLTLILKTCFMTRVGPVHLILESLSKPEQSCTLQLLHLHLFRSTHACSGGVNGARCGDVTVCTWHRWCGHKGPFRALV